MTLGSGYSDGSTRRPMCPEQIGGIAIWAEVWRTGSRKREFRLVCVSARHRQGGMTSPAADAGRFPQGGCCSPTAPWPGLRQPPRLELPLHLHLKPGAIVVRQSRIGCLAISGFPSNPEGPRHVPNEVGII